MEIRMINSKDASDYLELMRQLDNETNFMMLEPDERKSSLEEIEKMIESNSSCGNVIFGAFHTNQMVAMIELVRGSFKRNRHSAYLVMGVLKSFGGQGLGSSLLKRADEWSTSNGICKLELTVMMNNHHAIKLYKKCGYEVEGTKKQSLLVNEIFVDEFYMGKVLDYGAK